MNTTTSAQPKKEKNVWLTLFGWFVFGLVLFVAIGYLMGGRFDPLKAALRLPSVGEQAQLLGQHSSKKRRVYVFDNGDYYYTVMSAYRFPFWRADKRTTYAYRNDDDVQLLGWYQERNRLNTMTVIPLRSFDPEVTTFVLGRDRVEQVSGTGEVLFFYWDRVVSWKELDGQALDAEGTVRYTLGYDDYGQSTTTSDIHWFAVPPAEPPEGPPEAQAEGNSDS